MKNGVELTASVQPPPPPNEPPPSYDPAQPPYGGTSSQQSQIASTIPGATVEKHGIPSLVPYGTYQPPAAVLPIVMQPGAPQPQTRWIAIPDPIPGCPPGLEFLANLSNIVVRQKLELLELVMNIEVPNRYYIETPTGEQIYMASEESDMVQAQVMRNYRGYRFKFFDGYGRVAFSVSRPLQCCVCGCFACFECCKRHSSVESQAEKIGDIRTRRSCCGSSLTIADGKGKDVISIDGPCCCSRCCSDADFPLRSSTNGALLGRIKRKYLGYIHSSYSNADVFEIEFPLDLDVRTKASVIGATILVDFLEFEANQFPNNRMQ